MLSKKDFEFKKVVVIFLNRGEKMSFRNDNLIVKDIDGQVKHQSTCYRLFAVYIVGSFTVTTGLIQRAKRFGFNIIFLTHSFRIYAVFPAEAQGNTLLHRKQYMSSYPGLPQMVVSNKINNQIAVLKKARQHGNWVKEVIYQLNELAVKAANTQNSESLLGIEGSAARQYFSQIYAEFSWTGRKPRVKHDINNCITGYWLHAAFYLHGSFAELLRLRPVCRFLPQDFLPEKIFGV